MKTIEDYNLNGDGDYYGFLDITDFSKYEKLTLQGTSFHCMIGEREIIRMGFKRPDWGTKVGLEEFTEYFDHHGQALKTYAEYEQMLADNAPEEIG